MTNRNNNLGKYFLLPLLLAITLSCKKKESIEYHPNGNIKYRVHLKNSLYHGTYKEFYENGGLKTSIVYKNGKKEGMSLHIHKQGHKFSKTEIYWENDSANYQKNYSRTNELISEGPLLKYNFKNNKWKFYDSSSYLKEVQEFVDISNKPYLNQRWLFNGIGDTIEGGNYYRLVFKDTIVKGESVKVYFYLEQPLMANDSELYVCLPKSKDLKNDFSNENEIQWDTIDNLAKRFFQKKKFLDRNHDVIFEFEGGKEGIHFLQGFLLEKSSKNVDTFDFATRKIYFKIPFFVSGDKN